LGNCSGLAFEFFSKIQFGGGREALFPKARNRLGDFLPIRLKNH